LPSGLPTSPTEEGAMSIWGRRDGEAPDEETREGQAGAYESQAGAQGTQEPAGEYQAGEPAPAFWRAQGQPHESVGRDPADAPPPDYGHVPLGGPEAPAHAGQASGDAPAPAMGEAPVLTGVVIDTETAVKDPAGAEQPAVAPEPAATEVQEPTVAVAHEPVVTEVREPSVTEPRDEAEEPFMTEAQAPVVTEPRDVAEGPVMTEAQEPAMAAATSTPQRWSEIMVAFVDDPRGSVKMAADAVDEAIGEFVNSVRARQRDLAATWQGAEADTEQLRSALREYRTLGQRVQELDLGEKTGA
jgi:hypothetical protein